MIKHGSSKTAVMQLPSPVIKSLSILSSFFLTYEHEYQIKITSFLMQFICIILTDVVLLVPLCIPTFVAEQHCPDGGCCG